jgi:hypothetical protein
MKTGFRSIGEVRSVTPSEMQPIFGSYRQPLSGALRELFFLAVLMTVIAFVTAAFSLPSSWRFAAFPLAILMASLFAVGIWLDANTVRIVGPDGIGIRSPIQRFSWSIPTTDVERCQLVEASPHRKLRIIKKDGSAKSIPVTRELWDAVMNVKPPS